MFNRPTRQFLIDRDAADLSTATGFDAQARRSLANALAQIHAAGMDGLYGMLERFSRQLFPWSVEGQFALRYAAWNGIQPKPAAPALGAAAGTAGDGQAIPDALEATRADGAAFVVTAATEADAEGNFTVTVQAVAAGSDGNTPAGTVLTLSDPPAGIGASLTVGEDGLAGGTPAETVPAMMARVQLHQQQPGQGGAASDWVQWTLAQTAVATSRAWCLPAWTGVGNVGVAAVNDDADPITFSGPQLAAIAAAIAPERPVRSVPIVIAPTLYELNPTLTLSPADDGDIEAAVTAALDTLLLEANVSGSIDPVAMTANDGGVNFSDIAQAIKTAAGVTDYFVSLIAGAAPVRRIVPPEPGMLIVLGTPVWD